MAEDARRQLLAAALEYASYGWRVLPLRDGKIPRIKGWQREASCDEEQVAEWWEQWPDSNVGVKLGPESGLVDVECDSPEAEQLLLRLFAGDPVVTPTFQSSRGKHRLFKWRPDLPSPTKNGFKLGKLEIRTGNGDMGAQSVFPPSRHPSGIHYAWLVHPSECPVADFTPAAFAALWNATPEDLLNESVGSSSSCDPIERARKYVAKMPPAISGQGGHNMTFRVACVLVLGFALSAEQAWPLLEEYNARCDPPWNDRELRHKLEDAEKQAGERGYLLARTPSVDVSAKIGEILGDLKDPFDAKSVARAWELIELWNRDRRAATSVVLQATFDGVLQDLKNRAANQAAEARGLPTAFSASTAGAVHRWRLVIVESRPRSYRLYSPIWSAKAQHGYIVLDDRQIHDPKMIAREALEQAGVWVPGSFAKLWLGDKQNPSLAGQLVDAAEYLPAPLEVQRDRVVAELLAGQLARGESRQIKEGEPPDPQGRPCQLPDGSIAFQFGFVWASLARGDDKVQRKELSEILQRVDCEEKAFGPKQARQRFRVLTKKGLDALSDLAGL